MPLKTLDELLAWADIVTLHIPRTKDTTNLLSEQRMRAMKPGAYLVNAARGGLVDEAALLDLLDDGRLAGAALDTSPPNRCRRIRRCARAPEADPDPAPGRFRRRSRAGGERRSWRGRSSTSSPPARSPAASTCRH